MKTKCTDNVFQSLFDSITNIVREMWLERNMDRQNPIQGHLKIAKITESTRIITHSYSLKILMIPQHDLKYHAMELPEMLEQSHTCMLKWATIWKPGICHSIRRANYY